MYHITSFTEGVSSPKPRGASSFKILRLAIFCFWIPCFTAEDTCRVCGCDGCIGDQYDTIGNPGGIITIPPNLQSGTLTNVTELQCFWLPFMEIFLGGLDFCTDDDLRLSQEFRDICGCADLPIGVNARPGSLDDFLETLVDNPSCNVCGSDVALQLAEEETATFIVSADRLDIFPETVIDNAIVNDDGSAVVSCQTVELAGWHHHFSEATCSEMQQLQEFKDGCECRATVVEDHQGSCDLCGCEGCPPFIFHMANQAGSIPIPEELHGEKVFGLTEIHCWMIELASQQRQIPNEECSMFQTFELFRESCGCPPIPAQEDVIVKTGGFEERSATSSKNSAGTAFAVVFGISAAVVFAFVVLRKTAKNTSSQAESDGITIDESTISAVNRADDNVFI